MFKDVEPDIIFRHLVWSVLFIVACAYYINTQILPNVADYKEQLRFTRVSQATLEQTRAINESVESRVDSFTLNKSQKLWGISTNVNEKIIKDSVSKGFLKIDIRKKGEENITQDQIKKTFYSISGEVSVNNLSLILEIVPRLHKKSISAILELPLSIKKNTKGNLDFVANIAITQSTYKYPKDI